MWKELDVVVLPSISRAMLSLRYDNVMVLKNYPKSHNYTPHHVYFLSDEVIKEGDWWMLVENNNPVKVCKRYFYNNGSISHQNNTNASIFKPDFEKGDRKIIATTDATINLPQISWDWLEHFIKSWNNEKKIDKAIVNYLCFDELKYNSKQFKKAWDNNEDYSAEINEDNTIKTMGYHSITGELLDKLHELADLQHPHLKGDNHTRTLVDKVYRGEHLCASEAFDCGKYYQRMLDQLPEFEGKGSYDKYLSAVLAFKWCIK